MSVPINGLGDESGNVLGIITFANRFEGSGPFTIVDKNYANHIAKLIGVVKSRDIMYGWIIDRLSAAMEQKDRYTGNHCRDVMHNCISMGEMYGLDDASKDHLAFASLLHDLGKLCVGNHILTKRGSLNDEEWKIIKLHPSLGADIIEMSNYLGVLAEAIRCHHEKPNGTGYPAGTRSIPLLSTFMSVADTYSAMTSQRVYKENVSSHEEADKEIKRCVGSQFTPQAVEVYDQCFKRGTWRVSERPQ
jgi:HD-GYP domain-containing protein (c-di-GMP phosphodiesterase class II)